jgi:fibronectin-binding autotransporter adhesin
MLAVLFSSLTLGNAATLTWNAASGAWEDSGNWNGGVPVASSTAILNNGGVITVTNGTAESGGLPLGGMGTAGNAFAYDGAIVPTAGKTLSVGSPTLGSSSTVAPSTTSATNLGQTKVSGDVSLPGVLELNGLGFLTANTAVTLIDETGSSLTSGSFSTVSASGTQVAQTAVNNSSLTFTSNKLLSLLSSSSSEVTLTAVPEPPHAALLMVGVCLLGCVRRILRPRYL